jgi:hypothetical protein
MRANSGHRVLFEPRARAYDRLFEEPGREFRRKVRTLAGNFQLVALEPGLLDPRRNRLFWSFVSHKLTRLAVPWCLGLMFLSSGALTLREGGLYTAVFALQAAVYLLAVLAWPLRLPAIRFFGSHGRAPEPGAAALGGFLFRTERAAWRRAA